MNTNAIFFLYLAQFFVEWKIFQIEFLEEIEKHIFYWIAFFFRKFCRSWDNVEKYFRAEQATDDNMAQEHCLLDTWGYKHTLRMCNINFFPTATMLERTRLLVDVTIHCLSCYLIKYMLRRIWNLAEIQILCTSYYTHTSSWKQSFQEIIC